MHMRCRRCKRYREEIQGEIARARTFYKYRIGHLVWSVRYEMTAVDSWVVMSLGDNNNEWLVKASDKFCIISLRMKEHIKFIKGSQVKQLYQLIRERFL